MKRTSTNPFEQILAKHPEFVDMTVEECMAWLRADIEDRENAFALRCREAGVMPELDLALFEKVGKPFRSDTPLVLIIDALRAKRHRGHLQQRAIELYDEWYASGRIPPPWTDEAEAAALAFEEELSAEQS